MGREGVKIINFLFVVRKILFILSIFICSLAFAENKGEKPDLDKIREATLDEKSKYFYPKLMRMFLSNDTLMTTEHFRHLYYGALFQEDYDPYRAPYDEAELQRLTPLYSQSKHSRQERREMLNYAQAAIADNPLDLVQLKNLIYVYEQNQKVNLAKIWKNKLNHLLEVIGTSGTGLNEENAWYIVYPRHEFDFLNITGIPVQATEFVSPYYEKVTVPAKEGTTAYYFNLQPVLEQYYRKHPGEM